MDLAVGESWNESELLQDPMTLRPVRRLTRFGQYNQSPVYHTNTAFTSDGRYLVLASARGDNSYVVRAEVETGSLTAIARVEGVGSRDYMHRFNLAELGNGNGVCGNRVTLAPRTGWVVYVAGRSLLAVHLHSFESRVLIEDIGPEWIFGAPAISPDGTRVAIAVSSAHPRIVAGQRVDRDYASYPDHRLQLLVLLLAGGPPRVIFERQPAQCAHCSYSPADPHLLYFDLDVPPQYWNGNDAGQTPRIWLIDDRGGRARALRASYPGVFTVHAAWTWDGSAIAYHGYRGAAGYSSGIFIGVTRIDGTVVRDYEFPSLHHYGHVGADPRGNALILDGDLLPGCISRLYYDSEIPRLEVLCRHDTEWESLPGQYSHPHPQYDASGRRICFNAAHGGRSDVYVVSVA